MFSAHPLNQRSASFPKQISRRIFSTHLPFVITNFPWVKYKYFEVKWHKMNRVGRQRKRFPLKKKIEQNQRKSHHLK